MSAIFHILTAATNCFEVFESQLTKKEETAYK
jgi:hypothetical protein